MRLSVFLAVSLTLLTACSVSAQAAPIAVRPSATNSQITRFDEPDMVWVPQTSDRHLLVLFLPGTNGRPQRRFPFGELAAGLGYHVISLMYPDRVAAQQRCSLSFDPAAYLDFRRTILYGGHSPWITVAPWNSIRDRLWHLLFYLRLHYPQRGWSQFLTRAEAIRWSRVVVAGQSQGGGHAYVLSKDHRVARVLMFGSPKDYSHALNAPARGFNDRTRTPLDRYFAFNHLQDSVGWCNHTEQMQIFKQMGLTRLGSTLAEQARPDFGHAHLIFTDLPTDHPHTSVISGSLPVDLAVWLYMLTTPTRTSAQR